MHPRVRELIDYARECGFTVDAIDGQGHYRLAHPNGTTYRVASTPGDYRGDDNAKADLRRLSGVTPPKPNAGKYRKGERRQRFHMPTGATRRPDQTGTHSTGEFDNPGRARLEAEAVRIAGEYKTNPSGALHVQLMNVLARIRNNIY